MGAVTLMNKGEILLDSKVSSWVVVRILRIDESRHWYCGQQMILVA